MSPVSLSSRLREAGQRRDAQMRRRDLACRVNALAFTDQGHLLTREMARRGFRQGLATESHSQDIKQQYEQLKHIRSIDVQSSPHLCT